MPENDGITPTTQTSMISELRKILKRLHYPLEVMLVCGRWYAAYPLSWRHLEEMMQERGVFVDTSHCVLVGVEILPGLALVFRGRKRFVGTRWRLEDTYTKLAEQWKYLYSAVDAAGATVDFLRTAKRDLVAARRFLERATNLHGLPEKITIDKSGANTAAIKSVNADACIDIEVRQPKYLNNIIEQHHRAVKRVTDPMLGFKSFWSAQKLIAGIEVMHMMKKRQSHCPVGLPMSAADQFRSLAF